MTHYTLNDAQNGSALSLRLGDAVILHLKENPATGYCWEIAAVHGFVLEADDFIHVPTDKTGGGERALRFKATSQGAARIEAVLRRSRETTAPPRSFCVTAEIRRSGAP
jgi:predicted secreted protein